MLYGRERGRESRVVTVCKMGLKCMLINHIFTGLSLSVKVSME